MSNYVQLRVCVYVRTFGLLGNKQERTQLTPYKKKPRVNALKFAIVKFLRGKQAYWHDGLCRKIPNTIKTNKYVARIE